MIVYQTYRTSGRRHGETFNVTITEAGPHIMELVQVSTPMGMKTLRDVDFPSANLGSASRDSYARSVLETAAYKWNRERKDYDQ